MKKLITAILIVVISFIFFVPLISRLFISQFAQSKAQELLKTKVTLSSAEIHFLTSTIVLNDFKIFHPDRPDAADGEIASIQYLKLTANPLLLVFKKEISINLKIISPKFHYTLTPNGIWELSGRFPLLNRGKNEKRMTPFNVEKIDISDGDIIYEDQFVSNPATSTHLSDIDVLIKNLQLPTQDNPLPTQFEASMDIEEDGQFHMEGTGDFLSPKINFTSEVTLKNISLQKFSPYYQSDLPVILQKVFTTHISSHL
ncbi:MAG: DUF748 domain-containing protein [Deltaproteobacteria bacterium]|nr:MAG: DUF748 domain-containing protein [Deltaproteobacteria bacterium]